MNVSVLVTIYTSICTLLELMIIIFLMLFTMSFQLFPPNFVRPVRLVKRWNGKWMDGKVNGWIN